MHVWGWLFSYDYFQIIQCLLLIIYIIHFFLQTIPLLLFFFQLVISHWLWPSLNLFIFCIFRCVSEWVREDVWAGCSSTVNSREHWWLTATPARTDPTWIQNQCVLLCVRELCANQCILLLPLGVARDLLSAIAGP